MTMVGLTLLIQLRQEQFEADGAVRGTSTIRIYIL